MSESTAQRNKGFVLEAFETLQQEGLRRSREVLVVELYSTQRPYTVRA